MSVTPSTRGPYRSGIARRRQIISAAGEVFASEGYRGGSMSQIAREVGVTPAALTRHFGSKDELLIAVLRYWEEQTDQLIEEGTTGVAYFSGLRDLVSFHVAHRGYLQLFLTLSTEATNPLHPAAHFIRERYDATRARFSAQLAAAIDQGDARPMDAAEIDRRSRALIAYLDGIELQWLLDPHVDLRAEFDQFLADTLESWRR